MKYIKNKQLKPTCTQSSTRNESEGSVAVIAVLIVVITLLSVSVLVAQDIHNKNSQDANSTHSNASDVEPAKENGNDKEKDEKKWKLHYGIHGSLIAYRASTKDYPKPTAAGWNAFVTRVQSNRQANNPNNEFARDDPLIDPFTGTTYVFTDKDPDYGEIQYRYPASCDTDTQRFKAANSSQSYAFRLKYSDEIRCSHSL